MTTQPAAHTEAANPPTTSTSKPKREHFSTDLSPKEMETRRLQAVLEMEVAESGASLLYPKGINGALAAIGRLFKVSRTTVSRWNKMRKAGKSLLNTKAFGRPRFLTPGQEQQIKIHCERGITYEGLREQLAVFGVKFSKDSLVRLRKRLGIPLIFAKPGPKRERP